MPRGFSLWLLPGEPERTVLERLICRLAEEHGGPVFPPHLTLLGGLAADPAKGEAAALLAARLPPFSVAVSRVSHTAEYFRCLYLEVAGADALLRARREAEDVFGSPPGPFAPHLSLFYGTPPPAKRERMALAVDPLAPRAAPLVALALFRTAGEVASWAEAARLPLAGPVGDRGAKAGE
jgi:hypothetical protein